MSFKIFKTAFKDFVNAAPAMLRKIKARLKTAVPSIAKNPFYKAKSFFFSRFSSKSWANRPQSRDVYKLFSLFAAKTVLCCGEASRLRRFFSVAFVKDKIKRLKTSVPRKKAISAINDIKLSFSGFLMKSGNLDIRPWLISAYAFFSLSAYKAAVVSRGLILFLKKGPSSLRGFFPGTFAVLAMIVLVVSSGFIAAGSEYYLRLASGLPEPTLGAMLSLPESTRIYDRNGELLYEAYSDMKRRFIRLDDIPDHLEKATIAIEDKNFYSHKGYELSAIMRAVKVNIENWQLKQGASTITQQVARTIYLNNQKVFTRKLKELILAIDIEKKLSKDEILEIYLNSIPYGSVAYGVEAASEIYFGKPVQDLTVLESAYIAALPKAPSDYSPFGKNVGALHARAEQVLAGMRDLGYLSQEDYEKVMAEKKPEFKAFPTQIKAPHFVFYVLDGLKEKYGEDIINKGLDVRTSLDMKLQAQAEKTVSELGKKNEEKYGAQNAALTAIDTKTGEILAMVGSRDYFRAGDGAVNVALRPRQPGSSFKPYVYAAAFSGSLNPNSLISDVKTDFSYANNGVEYIPQNYNGKHYGQITVRKALAGSLNVPAVKVLVDTGIGNAIDLAEKLGISTLKDRERFGPALALGGGEVKLLEHTAALGSFGNAGIKLELAPILSIKDRNGRTMFEQPKQAGVQAVSQKAAYEINDILSDNQARQFIFGRADNLVIPGRKVAVKTGTTQDFRDAWTIGYTPSLAVGVWVGNNDFSPMKQGADGSVVAAPIWKEFMTAALKGRPAEEFKKPDGYKVPQLAVKKKVEPVKEEIKKDDDDNKTGNNEIIRRKTAGTPERDSGKAKNPKKDIATPRTEVIIDSGDDAIPIRRNQHILFDERPRS